MFLRMVLTSILLTGALTASGALAQAPRRFAPCPPPGDTLSLLQPSDSAYRDAPAVSRFLQERGFMVHCVTRSMASGLLGMGRVAGFQTDRGTITVFILPDSDHVNVTEARIVRGYRYTFARPSPHAAHATLDTNGRVYYLARGDWFIEVWDSALAGQLRRLIAESQ